MTKVGFIGWRGMVGSVLMERMAAENDFAALTPTFFSTSQVGQMGPKPTGVATAAPLQDAHDIDALGGQEVIVTCQGGTYTRDVHARLRASGWDGYWLDAASALRMADDSVIVLDPVNRKVIDRAIADGKKDFIGGNCTVSLMLMAMGGLFEAGLVRWVSAATYQAASGSGARHMRELVAQMASLGTLAQTDDPATSILELDRATRTHLLGDALPSECWQAPLAGSLIAWIDRKMDNGQTREEWKAMSEANKILQTSRAVPIDGVCVRIGAMRCHSQALTIKLSRNASMEEVEQRLAESNPWVRIVANEAEATRDQLSPVRVSGTLDIPVGRLRKMNLGPEYLSMFTVGDQLLWGAAEPVRRALRLVTGQSL